MNEKILLKISEHAYCDEKEHVKLLLESLDVTNEQASKIQKDAFELAKVIRSKPASGVESFIQQYSLTNEEGIAIMCLAEALLRIPDQSTAKELLEDKLQGKSWLKHFSKSKSLFVKASTIGLLFGGGLVDMTKSKFTVGKLVGKMGEAVVLEAVKKAIKMISNEFIIGENLPQALKNAKGYMKKGCRLSFDILGESSRTSKQADFYYGEYIKAIKELSKLADDSRDLYAQTNLSVKLTALHPKVLSRKLEQVREELMPKLREIIRECIKANITLSFDAEESYRQDIYLEILSELILDKEFANYSGIGFVVQGYSKRAFFIVDYLVELAKKAKKKIPVRLVKGAYWDAEIKHSQENGLKGYPVFTRKDFTDVSYLACAQKLIRNADVIYPQFATHNAHTVAAIKELAKGIDFEFQKLQGMGGILHDLILAEGYKTRIYAPVGQYKDLLAYLMRRLLENGANSSFVNLIGDNKVPVAQVVDNPITKAKAHLGSPPKIVMPSDIYTPERRNSEGLEIGIKADLIALSKYLEKFANKEYNAYSIISGKSSKSAKASQKTVTAPFDDSHRVGTVHKASDSQLKEALDKADKYTQHWHNLGVGRRAEILNKFADLLHDNRFEIYALLAREAGKTIDDAVAEVREAIDFARYYSAKAVQHCSNPIMLPGYTGEKNYLTLNPRGVFLCISPWNFPLAIFAGQVLAALATGNTVLAKPAENTMLIAHYVVKLLHEAGVPGDALHLLLGGGAQIAEILLLDPRIQGVCFTGSTEVARGINRTLAARNSAIVPFIAETGGQNCMIVDSSALLEQAVDSIISSAFGSAGQRCSALRVLFAQEDIFPALMGLLEGAIDQLVVGNPQNLSTDIGPVISAAAKKELEEHITSMQNLNKAKLLMRHQAYEQLSSANASFVVPHVIQIDKIQDLIQENFGPVLHVIPFKVNTLDKVINEINSTGFGLTFGIQTRIEDRIFEVASRVKVGNFYANRSMIGAHVGTHPFGGEGNSGTGFKAGGPHYLLRFMVERVVANNVTAIGGNVELLS